MWTCPKCREDLQDNFDLCWNCGTDRVGTEAPTPQTQDAPDASPAGVGALPADGPAADAAVCCSKCGSDRVVPEATIWDQGQHSTGSLRAYVYARPDALLFKQATYAMLHGRICGDCGHVEVFTDAASAGRLYQAYLEQRSVK